MKMLSYLFLILIVLATITSPSWAAPVKAKRDIAESKNSQAEMLLQKAVDEKQAKVVQLINLVGTYANDRFSNEIEKEEAQVAYNGFIARLQGIREDRENLERKEIIADLETLNDYSKRLDRLSADLLNFFK